MYQKFRRWNNLKITQYVAHLEYIIPSFALLQISVILNSHNVQIINHIYSYNIFIEGKEWEKLIDFFNQEVESRREVLEQHITSNIKHSLQTIYKNIV